MRSSARVVVIGGGAVGAACMYHLTKAGVDDCLLIEKDELTSGSTWHAAGNIPTYANSWLGMRAGNYAWRLYKDLAEEVGSAITYRHTGAFWPAHTRDRMDLFSHLVGVSKSAGFELAMLSPTEMEAMHPHYRAGDSVIGGIHDPYEGDIDPSQLTQALVKGARAGGAEVTRFTRVTGIGRNHDREWRISTDKGDVCCEIVVNATGFYGAEIGNMLGQQLPVAVLEHQYLVTDALDQLRRDDRLFPLVRDPDIRFYLRREGASLLFGSYGHPGRLAFADGIPDRFAHSLFEDSVDDIVDLIEQAIEHVPLLGEAGIQRFVNGPIGYSPDALPLCGPASGLPNFYHACGIQIGITHSAAVGKAISEWITEGETEWDYSAWDPRRFGDWATTEYAQQRIVELYDLQYAIPFPHRIIESGRPLQATPLYHRLKDKGAVFGQIGGWERAFWFDLNDSNDPEALSFRQHEPWQAAVKLECESVRDRVGVMDHGGFTKYEVSGPGASAYLDRLFCGRLPRQGRVKLSYLLTPRGKIWSEATIAGLGPDRYLLCGPTLADLRDYDWLYAELAADASVKLQRGYRHDAALLVMGPQSRALLAQLTDHDLSSESMPWMSVAQIRIAGCETTAMRVSYVGELGWELHLACSDLVKVYDEICRPGEDLGLVDFGSWALNAMRVEKAYHGWGSDFGSEYTMFDAGLEKFIDFDKADFIGRDAVMSQKQQTPDWRFVRLTVDIDDAEPLPGDPILSRGKCIGYVTSASAGYRIGQCVALGYIDGHLPTSELSPEIEVLGKARPAQACKHAFYDPDHSRCRA
ncbi:MAG: FAD-dependent oxidoreductase [Gammaproteobacteria bacterium]|nr:FAD-dependent oxidoreductase [Gammaproteobacteria bacterium]